MSLVVELSWEKVKKKIIQPDLNSNRVSVIVQAVFWEKSKSDFYKLARVVNIRR